MKFLSQTGLTSTVILFLIGTIVTTIFLASKQFKQEGPSVSQSNPVETSAQPTATPSATPTATPSAKPKASATPKPSVAPTPAPVVNNTPPGSGFAVQTVSVDGQNFKVAIVAADLNSTRVIVDTASESDCASDCPVLSLGDYASRNGAWAGINGSYFCPADYASCADKKNSFDTLLMNKNKRYFNSDNNVYSTVPAAIFSAGSARFVGQSLEWGRDTGVDSVIANYPLLVAGGNINFTEAPNEPKFGGAASRTFIASKGNMVYIGIV